MTYSLIPESAPFTSEQRAWLNGFFAGWVGLDQRTGSTAALPAAALDALPAPTPAASEPEESFPWHDPNLTIVERLELAEGKPLERRLMAAMAQLDCGACGYVCKTYSEAIAAGKEKNLTLCSPGGKNTAKAIKQLLEGRRQHERKRRRAKAATNGHAANGHAARRQRLPPQQSIPGEAQVVAQSEQARLGQAHGPRRARSHRQRTHLQGRRCARRLSHQSAGARRRDPGRRTTQSG